MCPACLATTALVVAGVASAGGGLAAFVAARVHARSGPKGADPEPRIEGGEDGSTRNGIAD